MLGVPVLSLDLGLGLIYIKTHKNLMECSGTFHLFYAYLMYSTGFYTTIYGGFRNILLVSATFYYVPWCSERFPGTFVLEGSTIFHYFLQCSVGFHGILEHSTRFRWLPLGSVGPSECSTSFYRVPRIFRNIPGASGTFYQVLPVSMRFHEIPEHSVRFRGVLEHSTGFHALLLGCSSVLWVFCR